MEINEFEQLLEWLTGTPVKGVTDEDREFLETALSDDKKEIDCSQFNELLLIANKDRMKEPFFQYFFGSDESEGARCRIGDIPPAVTDFQKKAMLRYGNFIFGYRTLARKRTKEELLEAVGEYARIPAQLFKQFTQRRPKVIEVKPIPRDKTYFVGHISAQQVIHEHARAEKLIQLIDSEHPTSLEDLAKTITTKVGDEEAKVLLTLLDRWNSSNNRTVEDLAIQIRDDLPELKASVDTASDVQKQGKCNCDIYLTWDHMDVYFATSMRTKLEYKQLYDFVQELMSCEVLKDLNLRYFDPTQSFEPNRIDKGLVEALMLKRAACTVYSVQDTDTLGKDSELAATLAQGKPVIAFAPEIDVEKRTKELMVEDPATLQDRLLFVLRADESFSSSEMEFVETMSNRLKAAMDEILWRSLKNAEWVAGFQADCGSDLERFCQLIALSEARIYNRRADTLMKSHPLAIQVHLDTGVANGVLVARDPAICAKLIRRVLLNEMEFDVLDDDETGCWVLKERLTGSIYRVVTKNRKLTNCFWNYYAEN